MAEALREIKRAQLAAVMRAVEVHRAGSKERVLCPICKTPLKVTQLREVGTTVVACEIGCITALPFVDDSFDCVVSFETIEHVQAQEQVLAELRRVLRPDGFMLMSSPDKAVYTDAHGTDNPHHVRELYRDEFETLLATRFPATRLLGQKLLFHSVIWSPEGVDGAQLQSVSGQRLDNTRHVTHAAMYWLALCAAGTEYLPDAGPGLWLFDDTEESVYRHYQGEIRRNMNAGGIIAERDHEIETLRRELESARSARSSWLGRLFRR
jgi:SAM-dependent methyltransferase